MQGIDVDHVRGAPTSAHIGLGCVSTGRRSAVARSRRADVVVARGSFVQHRNADVVRGRVLVAGRYGFGARQALRMVVAGVAAGAGYEFVSLAGEQNAKLIAEIVLKVNQTGVGVHVFGAYVQV